MRVALLGPTTVVAEDGTPVDIGGARVRMLLARLALDPGRPVPTTTLIDDLWGEQPPADASNALQSLVSRLRKVCPVSLEPGGYRLGIATEDVDVFRFDQLRAAGRLDEALALWRGEPLADVREAPFAQVAAAKFDEARLAAEEERFTTGELDAAALTAMHERHPLRERLAGLLMRALCAQGRQSDALQIYAAVRGRLADELGVDPSAELQQVHLAALRGELGPRAAVDRLPVRLTSFVGRDDELAEITGLLGQARLVTLVGPGGAGKTRLATEVAARHPLHAKGRVWFAALAGVRAAEDLAGVVLGAFELSFGTGDPLRRTGEGMNRIADVLGAGESLLVLDNCEHLISAAAEFTNELLRRVPNLRVLATSREPLAIDGESLCPVGPLAVPDGQDDVSAFGAVRLFLDRASAVKPGFQLDESTVDDVKLICRRLDGMPLALELAAARLRSMTVRQITQRLDDRFRLLTSGSRTALPRQRTLRAVVEWSWDLLTEEELRLARRIAVFPAGADLAAIEQVCAEDSLYVLTSLVEKSIVDVVELDAEPRYRMLETIRVYAAEQLEVCGEKQEIVDRFRRYYRDLTGRWEPLTRTARQVEAIGVYEAEQDNIVAALRGAIDDREVGLAADLLAGVFWYWLVKGDNERAELSVRDVLALGDGLPADVHATFRAMQLIMAAVPGLPATAEAAQVIEDCVSSGAADKHASLAIALPMLAFLSQNQELARREVKRAAASEDAWARAGADWALSFILVDEGDLEGAEVARDRAYEQFVAVGDRWGSAMTLGMKATFVSHTGDNLAAIALYQRGLDVAMELRSLDDAVQQRWRLAVEYARLGDHATAEREVIEAEQYVRNIGNDQMSIMIDYAKAEVLLRAGRIAEARELSSRFKRRATLSAVLGSFVTEWSAILDSRIAIADGDPAEAEKRVAVAIGTTSQRSDMPDLATVTELLAQVRYAQGRHESASRLLGLAAVIRGRLDMGDPDMRRLVAELGEPEPLGIAKAEALREVREEAGISDS
ncbi:BTAD domain-containing putative transcriptional regulator [Lentzea sp. BCCO 10_0856]|uniref:BTAD domain-containing putative transcriptional regulator n=1 Tax=Lentzea miocenica TaxID=3095431 RepID=A0ABU4SXQ5_9PSEU|nr:BTAD domain-containing putative transcriptional regulator [Lentzea sp. BCCO 10_0856]MDX8030594.1 BTAD domain-containing putative transcriptional regulator [Lentzea sp. BCCO 10_0856]